MVCIILVNLVVTFRGRAYRATKVGNAASRGAALKCKYGLTEKDYLQMFVSQDGCCAICGVHQSVLKRRLSVDHNHATKVVRGLLCSYCNHYLSAVEDIEWYERAVEYLVKHLRP